MNVCLFYLKGGGGRGGGGGGFKGGKTVIIEPHRHEGVFIARGKEDALVTRNFVPGSEVYGEKRISVEVSFNYIYFHLIKRKENYFMMIMCRGTEEVICGLIVYCRQKVVRDIILLQ